MTPTCNVFLPAIVLLSACSGVFSSYVFHLTDRDFATVLRDKDLMLVSFIAPWCEHCKELDPQLDSAAMTLATKKHEFVFAKVDCQSTGRYMCKMFNIQALPTFKLFRRGRYVGDYIGQTDKNSLLRYVNSVASSKAQQAPLSLGTNSQASLGQVVNPKLQAVSYSSNQAYAPHAQAPQYAASKTPSPDNSFFGDQVKPPSIYKAAYAPGAAARHSNPDTLQSKFGNLAYFEVYKAKLKMIAAYKNYEKRLHEYKNKLGNFTRAAAAKKQQNSNPAYQSYYSPQTGQTSQYPGYSSAAYAGYQTPYSYSGGYRSKLHHAKVTQQKPAKPQHAQARSFTRAWHGRTAPAQYPSAQAQQQQPAYYAARPGGYQAATQKVQVQQQQTTLQQQQMYATQQQQQQQQQRMYAAQQQQQQADFQQQQQQQQQADLQQQQQQQQADLQQQQQQQQQADLQQQQQQQQQADLQQQLQKQQKQQQQQHDQSQEGQNLSELLNVTTPNTKQHDGDKDALQNLKNDIEDAIQDALKDTGSQTSDSVKTGETKSADQKSGEATDARKDDGSGSGSGSGREAEVKSAVKGTSSDASGSGSGNDSGSGSGM